MNDDFSSVATAPGDIPLSEVMRRVRLQAGQWRHDNTIQPLAPTSAAPVEVWATSGLHLPIETARVRYTTDGSLPAGDSFHVDMQPAHTDWQPLAGYLTRWKASLPPQPHGTVVRYQIVGRRAGTGEERLAQDGQGFWFRYEGDQAVQTFAYRVSDDPAVHPAWLQDAVIYQIFLDRFHPGTADGAFGAGSAPSGIHGGTLHGVERALPYLEALGANCLWLSPIGPAPSAHRYDATDYFDVDPALGTKDDLRRLTAAAHARGIRVLLDFVPSHLSAEHPAFVAARQDATASTRSWFVFYDWPDHYRSFLEMVPELPSVNTNDPAVRRHIIDSALHWVDLGVDGFRLDHAIGHGMDFWTELRAALEAVRDDIVLIGEVTDTPDALRRFRGRLHDALDFPLAGALRQTFGSGAWSVAEFDAFLTAYEAFMRDGPGRVSFLDNHDMDRFSHVASGDANRVRLAALCQLSLAEPPVIYYGTEIGLPQRRSIDDSPITDNEVRQDMVWDPARWDADLLAFYQAAVRLRKERAALRRGERATFHVDEAAQTLAYRVEAEGEAVLAAFNLGERPRCIPLPDGHYRLLLATGGGALPVPGGVELPPMTGAWLVAD